MKIEVGEYVRTNGIIGKVEQIGNSLFWLEDGSNYSLFNKSIKHSKSIIDLIEVGDYVNGRLVLQTDCKTQNVCLLIPFTDTKVNTNIMWYGYEDIETILTKEQYQANCYTVERKEEC